jgi:leader peptidase (prepilin peptidase)/N-methyltransferase
MDHQWIWAGTIFIFGLVVGSFLNVCIYRIPRKKSIILPGSFCPHCGTPIHPLDNIPLLSYLVLAGKCRHCKGSISPRYPLVEFITGLLFVLLYMRFGLSRSLLVYAIFIAALLVITFIDLEHRIIPDVISLPGIPAGFALSFFLPQVTWISSVLGILLGGGLLLTVALVYELITHKEGMGMGDVKLLGMMGGVLGWQGVLFTIFMSSILGTAVGVIAMLVARADTKYAIPYGPFLSTAGLLYLFAGHQIIQWYLGW